MVGLEFHMINCEESLLMVIDVQGKLARMVENDQFHLDQIKKLILGSQSLSLPIILTAQMPDKIGHSVIEVKQLLPDVNEIPRTSFSVMREIEILSALNMHNRKQIILCGYEAHICLYQSAVDLISAGYEVYLVVDAISSRKSIDKEVAVHRVADTGGKLVTVEMLLFELLRDAKIPVFKTIAKLVK